MFVTSLNQEHYRKCNCRHNHGDNNGMKFKTKKKLMISLIIFVSAVRHESWADWFKLIKGSTQLRFNTKLFFFFIFIVQNSNSRQNCAKIWGCQGSKVLLSFHIKLCREKVFECNLVEILQRLRYLQIT